VQVTEPVQVQVTEPARGFTRRVYRPWTPSTPWYMPRGGIERDYFKRQEGIIKPGEDIMGRTDIGQSIRPRGQQILIPGVGMVPAEDARTRFFPLITPKPVQAQKPRQSYFRIQRQLTETVFKEPGEPQIKIPRFSTRYLMPRQFKQAFTMPSMKTRYTPSLFAVTFRIRAPKAFRVPKLLTGIEIRPIVGGF